MKTHFLASAGKQRLLVTTAAASFSIATFAAPAPMVMSQLPNSVHPMVKVSMPAFTLPATTSQTNDRIEVSISLKPRDPNGLQAFADAVSDPNSSLYRQYMAPDAIGRRFGALQKDVDLVKAFFINGGLKITHVGKTNITISANGTTAQVEKLFGTKIASLQHIEKDGTVTFRANTTPLNVPADLVSKIQSVDGIETYTRPLPNGTILTPTMTRTLLGMATPYSSGWTGAGRKVGISNWDGYNLANVPLFTTAYSLPIPSGGAGSNIHEIAVGGSTLASGAPAKDGDLDIQMVLGTSPLADIYVYTGLLSGAGLVGVLSQEVSDNICDIISESYHWNLTVSTAGTAHTHHVTMTAAGITYIAASGDTGTSAGIFDYPYYEPEVLLVGGTVATTDGAGNRVSETSWGLASGFGGGGGWATSSTASSSSFNVMPSWQVGTGVPLSSTVNKRLAPDVALHASGSNGSTVAAYNLYFNLTLTAFSGTSCAAPTFAGGLAQVQQRLYSTGGRGANTNKGRLGRIQNRIYAQNGRSDVWFDVTTGLSIGNLPASGGGSLNGTAANPGTKWDFATGWGVINFDAFYRTFFEAR